MIDRKDLIEIGKVAKTHSYKGEVSVLFDYDPAVFQEGGEKIFFIEMDGIPVPFFSETIRGNARDKGFVKFEDIDTEREASALTGRTVMMKKDDLADMLGISTDELELESEDCIGYEVVDASSHAILGKVTDIEEGPEYDYLVVENADEEKELTIPYIEEFVESIEDSEEGFGKIFVTLPEGYLDI